MYKFNLMWNEGPVNLIPKEHKDIYFRDSVVKAPIPRQEQLSSLGSTFPLCKHARMVRFEASSQPAACNQICSLSRISLWHKQMGINPSHRDI